MATCGSALRGTEDQWLVLEEGLSKAERSIQSLQTAFFDGYWYCEDLEREPVPCSRLDLLFFLKIVLSTLQDMVLDLSSCPPVSVLPAFPY